MNITFFAESVSGGFSESEGAVNYFIIIGITWMLILGIVYQLMKYNKINLPKSVQKIYMYSTRFGLVILALLILLVDKFSPIGGGPSGSLIDNLIVYSLYAYIIFVVFGLLASIFHWFKNIK